MKRRRLLTSLIAAAFWTRPQAAADASDVITPELVDGMRRLNPYDRETITQMVQGLAARQERMRKAVRDEGPAAHHARS